jgi:prepilin-type N-terminal cleavage/methylation domain-containing protein
MKSVPTSRRAGFTLIELLVVIAIIGILMALLLSALFKARALGEDLDARKDITELHKAVEAFSKVGPAGPGSAVGFMPSSFDPSGGDPASASYISRLFPHSGGKLNCGGGRMEGQQCLVFFLRGPNGQGWSTNPRDPCAAGGERIGPYFDFKPDRLTGSPPAYLDRFRGQPIAYFCATQWNGQVWLPNQYQAGDCASLGVQPYSDGAGGWMNLDSFQLICAGRNKKFGTSGGQWNPANAMQIYPVGSDGWDDITNFSTTLLGGRKQ